MRTLLCLLLAFVTAPAFAISFDPSTGTGNATAGEMPFPVTRSDGGFVLSQNDIYTVTVQYTNGFGQVVSQQQLRQAPYKFPVHHRVTASGIDFTGKGPIQKMGLPPQIGDRLPGLDVAGRPLVGAGLGVVTAVTFVRTDSQLNVLSGLWGDFKIW